MTQCILFHLHDNNKGRWPEQTKVIFDVQHQTTYTWRVWHHDDSKLITRQQASSCCEDKGLASICFCGSLNQKRPNRKGSHMKGPTCWESTELGALPLIKEVESLQEQRPLLQMPIDEGGWGGCCSYLSLQVTVCVCARFSFLSVCMLSFWHIR